MISFFRSIESKKARTRRRAPTPMRAVGACAKCLSAAVPHGAVRGFITAFSAGDLSPATVSQPLASVSRGAAALECGSPLPPWYFGAVLRGEKVTTKKTAAAEDGRTKAAEKAEGCVRVVASHGEGGTGVPHSKALRALNRQPAFTFAFARLATSAFATLAAILFTVAFLALGTTTASASCGFTWEYSLPTPFISESNGDYRFQYVETLARAEVNGQSEKQPRIPLNIFFSPVPEAYLGGKLLGQGWWLPPFESTLLQTDAHSFVMGLPNGSKVTLDKKGNTLTDRTWLGTIGTHETVLKTACGWAVKFQQGRLVELTSPDRERYQFAISRDGVRTITYNGRVVLSLTRKIDEKTTFPVYHLGYVSEGKSQKAELHMGIRPVLVKFTEKENGRDVTKEREENTDSLRLVKMERRNEKKYDFNLKDMTALNVLYQWDERTKRLVRMGDESFDSVKIRDITCLRRRNPNGEISLSGENQDGDVTVSQRPNGPIVITESFMYGVAHGKVKKITHVLPSGQEDVIRQVWYDEDGNPFRALIMDENDRKVLQTLNKNKFTAVDQATGKLIWAGTYDKEGQLVSCIIAEREYTFDYKTKPSKVIVSLKGTEKSNEISNERFDFLFGNLRYKNKFF